MAMDYVRGVSYGVDPVRISPSLWKPCSLAQTALGVGGGVVSARVLAAFRKTNEGILPSFVKLDTFSQPLHLTPSLP